jgi:hypothetical protein
MVDLAATRAQAKGADPFFNSKEGQTKVNVAKPLNVLSPPSIDGVDELYHQLAEIHVITVAPLVVCARWCQPNPTSSPVHAKDGW